MPPALTSSLSACPRPGRGPAIHCDHPAAAARLRHRAGGVHCSQSSPPSGSARTGGAFFCAPLGRARERLGGAAGRRLPGLPERLSPRPRCVLCSWRRRQGRPGRPAVARASARVSCPLRLPRGCASLPRAPQRASRSAVTRRISPTDRQAGQLRGGARDGRRTRSPLSARLAGTSPPGEGHRRGARRRLRHDGRPK